MTIVLLLFIYESLHYIAGVIDFMSRRLTHIIVGLVFGLPIVGVVYYFFSSEFVVMSLILVLAYSFCSIFIGSIFPDIIERPKNPDHRKFFHSWFTFSIVFIAAFVCCFVVIPRYSHLLFIYVIFGFLLGYFSHLLLDSTTKKSLT